MDISRQPISIQSPLLANSKEISHGFFTRVGGVSQDAAFNSLNISLNTKDSVENVLANRLIVQKSLGAEKLVLARCTHSSTCKIIESPDDEYVCDALCTNQPRVAIAISTADCTPILMADPKRNIVSAAHAGWKGALYGIIENTLEAMISMGSRPADIHCAIGPSIAFESYEVKEDFIDTVLGVDKANYKFFKKNHNNIMTFNMLGFIQNKLQQLNVGTTNTISIDTKTNNHLFFSHRNMLENGNQSEGRQASAICIKGK